MTQAKQFIQFVQQRNAQRLQQDALTVRIEGHTAVITRRWQMQGTEVLQDEGLTIPIGKPAY